MMEQPAISSSSKVKVEYHDPHGVLACVLPDLEARLPLRNLNWNSPGRPLRLIDTLFIEFESVDGEPVRHAPDSISGEAAANRQRSRSQSLRNRDSDTTNRKERRHQIPGLRRTPYLKLLVIRCDDTDTYKATTRKEVREWIKAHIPPSQKSSKSSNQENHDAFEYMILHVVQPDVNRRVSWPHRNSTKILGYLRDDFNSSSKHAIQRVAQVPSVRVSPGEDGKATIPDPTFGKQSNDAWDASLSTLKQLILSSFDQRVRQYEDDIKEKRAQRSLPGWNFCTFFVLKEGLSRGFESVGLVEDALSGYDELHAELDSTIRARHNSEGSSQDATMFRDAAPELQEFVKTEVSEASSRVLSLFDQKVIDENSKPYRDLILSSDISIFDFKTYIFAREISLLQRIGGAEKSASTGQGVIEARFLCDICQRTTAFIAGAGTILRDEAMAAATSASKLQQESPSSVQVLVLRIVSAWTYAVASHILDLINTAISGTTKVQAGRPTSASNAPTSGAGQSSNAATSNVNFKHLLSSKRAALTLTARRALEHLGYAAGWKSGWEAAVEQLELSMDEQGRQEEIEDTSSTSPGPSPTRNLKGALSDRSTFNSAFSALSQQALQFHQDANDTRASESVRTDIAIIDFNTGRYSQCAEVLEKVSDQDAGYGWVGSQTALLRLLCRCYKKLARMQDFVRVALKLIAYMANVEPRKGSMAGYNSKEITELFRECVNISEQLETPASVPLENYVQSMESDATVSHPASDDGFTLQIRLYKSIFSGIRADRLTVRLVSVSSDEALELPLTSGAGFLMQQNVTELTLSSRCVAAGIFRIKSVTLAIGKLQFVHEVNEDQVDRTAKMHRKFIKHAPKLQIWLSQKSPAVDLQLFEEVDLDRAKSVVLKLNQGEKILANPEIHLKAASAGLRLHTAQTKVLHGQCGIKDLTKPGMIRLDDPRASGVIALTIPFQLDFELKSIKIKCELIYNTENGQNKFTKTKVLNVVLPLGVNVQDVFKEKVLFSKFSISSSTGVPLRVLDYELEGTPDFKIRCPAKITHGFPVLAKQPACLTYQVAQEERVASAEKISNKLRLKISYQCLNEEILQTWKSSLSAGLETAGFIAYRRLLEDNIEAVLESKYSHHDLEPVALLREISTGTYDSMDWDSVLIALAEEEQQKLSTWLHTWHAMHEALPLAAGSDLVPIRKIYIPVEVPPMQIVHTAGLNLVDIQVPTTWHVGDAMPAELKLRHTTRWAGPKKAKNEPLTFNYELDAPPDNWIIGGQKRGLFSSSEGQELSFPVLLLPQRSGHLMLPGLDIRVVDTDAGGAQIHCEVDYRTSGESVLIMPAIDVPTLGANVRGERRSWLIDAN